MLVVPEIGRRWRQSSCRDVAHTGNRHRHTGPGAQRERCSRSRRIVAGLDLCHARRRSAGADDSKQSPVAFVGRHRAAGRRRSRLRPGRAGQVRRDGVSGRRGELDAGHDGRLVRRRVFVHQVREIRRGCRQASSIDRLGTRRRDRKATCERRGHTVAVLPKLDLSLRRSRTGHRHDTVQRAVSFVCRRPDRGRSRPGLNAGRAGQGRRRNVGRRRGELCGRRYRRIVVRSILVLVVPEVRRRRCQAGCRYRLHARRRNRLTGP